MKINDIVLITGSKSIPKTWLGSKGRITDDNPYKVTVLLIEGTETTGSFSHTAIREDLLKVGEWEDPNYVQSS
jgi:hypothetical protein